MRIVTEWDYQTVEQLPDELFTDQETRQIYKSVPSGQHIGDMDKNKYKKLLPDDANPLTKWGKLRTFNSVGKLDRCEWFDPPDFENTVPGPRKKKWLCMKWIHDPDKVRLDWTQYMSPTYAKQKLGDDLQNLIPYMSPTVAKQKFAQVQVVNCDV